MTTEEQIDEIIKIRKSLDSLPELEDNELKREIIFAKAGLAGAFELLFKRHCAENETKLE